jgi:mannose-1-phosphate guanylyltransferase
MSTASTIIPVILSGGGGTRLWPLSTTHCPKQFLALTDDATMFQLTLGRVADAALFANPMIIANAAHAELVEAQASGIVEGYQLVLEPSARNTAPAIALAALLAPSPDSLLLVMPSDHVITDVPAFHAAIAAAARQASEGWLATFGIAAISPEIGYGYIHKGEPLDSDLFQVQRFVEKPDADRAKAMVDSGEYAWNGGIFLFRADAYIEALAKHDRQILSSAKTAIAEAKKEGRRIYPDAAAFAASPSNSIDYAVMEKADRVAVVPVAMGWSDVGSWDALHALTQEGESENALFGDVLALDTKGSLIRGEGISVGVIGMEDVVVVATKDRVLVMPRSRAQDVRQLAEKL